MFLNLNILGLQFILENFPLEEILDTLGASTEAMVKVASI